MLPKTQISRGASRGTVMHLQMYKGSCELSAQGPTLMKICMLEGAAWTVADQHFSLAISQKWPQC